ncbi:hypothetical protein Tco_1001179 [Tanacetum coccineum]
MKDLIPLRKEMLAKRMMIDEGLTFEAPSHGVPHRKEECDNSSLNVSREEVTPPSQFSVTWNVNDGSDVWKNQHTWRIQSWKLYSFSSVHVLETVSGLVLHMFVHKKCPLSVNLIEKVVRVACSKRASQNLFLFFDSPLPGVNTPWDVMRIVCNPDLMDIMLLRWFFNAAGSWNFDGSTFCDAHSPVLILAYKVIDAVFMQLVRFMSVWSDGVFGFHGNLIISVSQI